MEPNKLQQCILSSPPPPPSGPKNLKLEVFYTMQVLTKHLSMSHTMMCHSILDRLWFDIWGDFLFSLDPVRPLALEMDKMTPGNGSTGTICSSRHLDMVIYEWTITKKYRAWYVFYTLMMPSRNSLCVRRVGSKLNPCSLFYENVSPKTIVICNFIAHGDQFSCWCHIPQGLTNHQNQGSRRINRTL